MKQFLDFSWLCVNSRFDFTNVTVVSLRIWTSNLLTILGLDLEQIYKPYSI